MKLSEKKENNPKRISLGCLGVDGIILKRSLKLRDEGEVRIKLEY
jgi:hypothetical protein